jgi:molybdate transport system ATP-binding protein
VTLEVGVRLEAGAFRLAADFGAPAGVTALFGPSGAGKTLTLRCIAGLTRPRQGRIAVGDRVLLDTAAGVDLPARERRVGYVFQQYALFPHLDVAENVAFGMVGSPGERRGRVARLLELVGLPGFEGRRPVELSGGQQQRVALARALAPSPELLLLDEPFSALDGRTRRRLRGELLRIHEATGVPMVLVTHDLPEVRELAGHVVLFDAGRVLRSGETHDVLGNPGSAEAQELLTGWD